MAIPRFLVLAGLVAVGFFASSLPAGATHNGDQHSPNMRLDWSLPEGPTRTHSDIAFWGDIGVAGNYDGFRVFDKETHQLYVSYLCRGPQDDVSLWRHNGRLLLFLSVDRPQVNGDTVCGQNISTDSIPLDAPETASVIAQPTISAPAYSGAVGCHDITVFLAIHKAAAACMSEGQLWDTSDPANPGTQSAVHIDDPSVYFWHSAEFTWDGLYVVFDDEGTGNCSATGNGKIWIYRTS